MPKKKLGRPPKPEDEKHIERVVTKLTRSQFQDLLEFETDKGIQERAESTRILLLESLRRYKARKKNRSQ